MTQVPVQLALLYAIGCAAVLVAAAAGFAVSTRFGIELTRRRVRILLILAVGFASYIPISQYLKYRSLQLYSDFSHWLQLLYSIVQTGRPESMNSELIIPGSLNYLSAHFVPFVYVLALPFAVAPYAETLLALNAVLMLSSVVPLYKLARRREGEPVAMFVAILFLGYPTFQYIVLYEFEMLRLSIPVLLWMLYFWEERRDRLYWTALAVAIFVREDVSLTVLMFGVYLTVVERESKRGLLTVAAGLAAFLVITQAVMPAFSPRDDYEHVAADIFGQFGRTPSDIARTIVGQPALLFATVAHPVKLANLFMLFLPVICLPLLAPAVLIGLGAVVAVALLSSSLAHGSFMLYYVAPAVPFVFYAIVRGWPRLVRVTQRFGPVMPHGPASPLIAAGLAGLLAANVFFGPSPLSLQFWMRDVRPGLFRTQNFHHSAYRASPHHARVGDFVDAIPDTAVVSAQQFLLPRLFRKRAAMVFPQLASRDGDIQADYVLIDITNNGLLPESPAHVPQEAFDVVTTHPERWRLITNGAEYYLYQRVNTSRNELFPPS